MNRSRSLFFILVALVALAALPQSVLAQPVRTYEITITNLTRAQIFSPPLLVSHTRQVSVFELGSPASAELSLLAEDGDPSALVGLLENDPGVFDIAVYGGMVFPGETVTLMLEAVHPFAKVTALGMLVSTNDAFFALNGVDLPSRRQLGEYRAEAYDAGSEVNSESCDFIPGPPCGSPGERDTDGAEGYVYVHSGISGAGDLMPAERDWRNPVARITLRRID